MTEAINKSEDLWSSYKGLRKTIWKCLSESSEEDGSLDLQCTLRKYKQNFFWLLQNQPKNAKSREDLKKGMSDGIIIRGLGHQILSKELYQEAVIISDMYDMNEFTALDLLCTAQIQMPYYPGLPRGLVAVLLYYEGRRALVTSLRYLVQARSGVQWCVNMKPEVEKFVTSYTDQLLEGGLFTSIFDLIRTLDLTKELEKLQENLALGGPRHRRQVIDLFQDIRNILADIVFTWAAHSGLPKAPTILLITYLKEAEIEEEASGKIDNVHLYLQMALLSALDLSVLHCREDGEEIVQCLPILSDPDYLLSIINELLPSKSKWKCEGLQAITNFGLAVCIASLQSLSQSQQFQEAISKEEIFIDAAIEANVFGFLHNILLENETLYKEEFLYKRIHYLISDFIVNMYRKVKELRIKADDIARTVQIYLREGLDAPPNLPRYFEYLLLSIGKFYGKKVTFGTEYVLSFWGTAEMNAGQYSLHRPSTRTVSLFKFIRLAGDTVPQTLFVPYLTMLSSLSTCQQAARHCFNILKQVGGVRLTASLSWDHFFMSFAQYYNNLRQEAPPTGDTVYRNTYLKGVSPQELEGLHTVLLIMRTIADHDEFSRLALCEHPGWAPLSILLGLVGCSVPIPLKADLLLTLASLSKSSENAVQMWENLEASQILVTVPSTSSYIPRGIQTELDEIESRIEEYPLTRAVLKLLDVLTDFGIPRTLGAGPRPPGFDPYFTFIVNSVFLKFHTRSYRNVSEKWEIANLCLCLFEKFLTIYEPQVSDFSKKDISHEFNSPPGYHLMIQMNKQSELLGSVLDIIDEGTRLFDGYVDFSGKTYLIECTLKCLNIINLVLSLQEKFVATLTTSGRSILFPTSLIKLLLTINRRSGRPDHCINIAKYISYQPYLLKHGLVACKILNQITATAPMHYQFINVFLASEAKEEIKQGFVLSLDSDVDDDSEEIIINTKLAIIKLLKHCLQYAAPNFSHFLFGFDLRKDISKTEFQYSGVLNFPRSSLHAIISLINVEMSRQNSSYSLLLESSYEILFLLASNGKTYGPVLRFLRFNKSFFIEHLNNCFARIKESNCAINQMSFLMKTLAVELKICGQSKQVSYLKQLTRYLVDLPPLVNSTNQDPYSTAFSDEDKVQFVSGERINNNFLVNLIPYFEITPEFADLLNNTTELDRKNEKYSALIQFVDAWRQVVEILVAFIPHEILTIKESQMIGVCFVLNLLKRVTKIQLLPEIGQLLSGAICLICEKLRKSKAQIHIHFLKEILENLIEWIMVSNVTDEKLRVNLYASLSTLLDLASLDTAMDNASLDGSTHVNRLNSPKLSLAKFGDRLIDVFCQDCIGGYEVAKMLALSSFGILVTLSGNLNWIVYMSGRGYLKYIIQSILESDRDLEQILQPEQTSIKPLYVYMSKIFFLGRLVETRVGAELVLEQKIFSCFSNMNMFSLHPEISKTCVEDGIGNFIPSPEELYLQMWLPTLELCNAVLTTLGTDNQSAIVQIMYFLINRLDVVETILRSGSAALPQPFLKELALLTAVISRTANNNLVNILENPEIVHDQRVHLFKIQKLILNLLPKFIITDEIATELVMKPMENPNTFQTSDRLLYALQVASNLLSYSRNVVSNHDVEHGGIGVLFSPTLIDPTLHTTNLKKSTNFNDQTLPLGVIVQYLITTVSHFLRQKPTYTSLKQRLQDPPSMNSKFLEDFIDESLNTIDGHSKKEHVRQLLSNILKKKQKEIEYCEFIIENALYLIWVHLDYYMLNAIPKMKNVGTIGGNSKSSVNITTSSIYQDEISNLKHGLISIFNENFCKQILETVQEKSELDKGFVETLLSKTIRLIQFVPVK